VLSSGPDTCINICIDALKDENETIKEEELLEKVRGRTIYKKLRHQEVLETEQV